MLFTLAEARSQLGKYVDSGSCNAAVIDRRIQEALERLMDMEDWECARRLVRVQVQDHHFTLPQNVEKILFADVDGTNVRVFSQPYQFLSSGPGDLDYGYSGLLKNILDKGDHWPTQFDIPATYTLGETEYTVTGMHLVARSANLADVGKEVTVFGFNELGEEVRETLTIRQWYQGVEGAFEGLMHPSSQYGSATAFKEVSRIVKVATTDYVTIMAFDPDTNFTTFLAKMLPAAGVPTFRRYSILNASTTVYNSVLALVKLRAVAPGDDQGVLPIDSIQALKLTIMSLREENAGNLAAAVAFEQQAKRVMDDRQKSSTMTKGTSIVIDFDFDMSLGRAMNHGAIL